MQRAVYEDVRIEGHLIDSGIMSKVMDAIIAMGGEFESLSFEVGRTNDDVSVSVLRVRAETQAQLESILGEIQLHGAVACQPSDVKLAPAPLNLDPIYETDMAEGLKAMAIEGHGLAFLPASSVKKELKGKRLVRAAAHGAHELTMDIRIYRERPEMARHNKPGALALWDFLGTAR